MYGTGLLAVDFYKTTKRTNLGIPNEINATRFARHSNPGSLDLPLAGRGQSALPHAIAPPARRKRMEWGRLDSGPTGGVFPARLEAGIAAPPHLKPGSEAGSGPISVLEGSLRECRLHCYFRARAARWSEWAGRWRRPIRRRVGSSTKSMRRLAPTSRLSFGRAPRRNSL